MNMHDTEDFQQAVKLAQSGQKDAAYYQFLALTRRNANYDNPDLLLWIAFTTPNQVEAQQALQTASLVAPNHPGLAAAQQHHAQKSQQTYNQQYQHQYYQPAAQQARFGPALQCPYCRTYAPVSIQNRISTAGWVVFTVLLFTTLIFCWIGLLIKEDYRVCSHCGMKLN